MTGHEGDHGNGTLPPAPASSFLKQMACLPLRYADADEAARLYAEVFLADEPTTLRRAPDPAAFLHYAALYVRLLAVRNLSLVVRDEWTQEIAGFIFCIDMTDDLEREGAWMTEFLLHFPEAVAMITELEDHFLDTAEITPGSVLHIYQIGVSRKYRGCGIAKALIRYAVVQARDHGFRKVVADCTHPGSRRSFEQCGFHEAGSLSYDAFSLDGVRFFAGLEGGISLMVRDL